MKTTLGNVSINYFASTCKTYFPPFYDVARTFSCRLHFVVAAKKWVVKNVKLFTRVLYWRVT